MTKSSTIYLRRYVTEDLDAVIEVFQRAIREVASRDYDPGQIAAWSTVDRAAWEPHRHGSRWTAPASQDSAILKPTGIST